MAAEYPNNRVLDQNLCTLTNESNLFPNTPSLRKYFEDCEMVEEILDDGVLLQLGEQIQCLSRLTKEVEARNKAPEGRAKISNRDNDELSLHLSRISLSESAKVRYLDGSNGLLAQGTSSSSTGALLTSPIQNKDRQHTIAAGYPNNIVLDQNLCMLANESNLFPNTPSLRSDSEDCEMVEEILDDDPLLQLEEQIQCLSRLIQEFGARPKTSEGRAKICDRDNDELSLHLSRVSLSESAGVRYPPGSDGLLAQGTSSSSTGALLTSPIQKKDRKHTMATGYPNNAGLHQNLCMLANENNLFSNTPSLRRDCEDCEMVEEILDDDPLLQLGEQIQCLSRLIQEFGARPKTSKGRAKISDRDNDELSLHLARVSLSESAGVRYPPGTDALLAQWTSSGSAGGN